MFSWVEPEPSTSTKKISLWDMHVLDFAKPGWSVVVATGAGRLSGAAFRSKLDRTGGISVITVLRLAVVAVGTRYAVRCRYDTGCEYMARGVGSAPVAAGPTYWRLGFHY